MGSLIISKSPKGVGAQIFQTQSQKVWGLCERTDLVVKLGWGVIIVHRMGGGKTIGTLDDLGKF